MLGDYPETFGRRRIFGVRIQGDNLCWQLKEVEVRKEDEAPRNPDQPLSRKGRRQEKKR